MRRDARRLCRSLLAAALAFALTPADCRATELRASPELPQLVIDAYLRARDADAQRLVAAFGECGVPLLEVVDISWDPAGLRGNPLASAFAWVRQPIDNASRHTVTERLLACAERWFRARLQAPGPPGWMRTVLVLGLLSAADRRSAPAIGWQQQPPRDPDPARHPFATEPYYALHIRRPRADQRRVELRLELPLAERRALEGRLLIDLHAYLARQPGLARARANPPERWWQPEQPWQPGFTRMSHGDLDTHRILVDICTEPPAQGDCRSDAAAAFTYSHRTGTTSEFGVALYGVDARGNRGPRPID